MCLLNKMKSDIYELQAEVRELQIKIYDLEKQSKMAQQSPCALESGAPIQDVPKKEKQNGQTFC